jgi:hypothetical protein
MERQFKFEFKINNRKGNTSWRSMDTPIKSVEALHNLLVVIGADHIQMITRKVGGRNEI